MTTKTQVILTPPETVPVQLITPVDNQALLFNIIPTDNLTQSSQNVSQKTFNTNNIDSVGQLLIDFGANITNDVFEIKNLKPNEISLKNKTLTIKIDDTEYKIDLTQYKFLLDLKRRLNQINIIHGGTAFDIEIREGFESLKSENLVTASNYYLDDNFTLDNMNTDAPNNVFLKQITVGNQYTEANTIEEYNQNQTQQPTFQTKYFIDTNSIRIPTPLLSESITIEGYLKNFSLSFSNIKIFELLHPTSDGIFYEKQSKNLTKNGFKLYKKISEVHSSFWGK